MNEHYTGQGAIGRIRTRNLGMWDLPGNLAPQPLFWSLVFFGSPLIEFPPIQNGDPCSYNDAAKAFITQAIYNGDGEYKVSKSAQSHSVLTSE
jgi:hypothetical protein